MRYKPLPQEVYIENRSKFTSHLKPGGLAVFTSNDIYPTGSDSTLPFRQHGDILALSGVDQEESILVIFPDAYKPEHREMLFLKETNEHIAIWEGAKLDKVSATQLSGIENIYWLQDFEKIFNEVMSHAEFVYLNTNEHLRADPTVETRGDRFVKWCKEKYPAHSYQRSAPIMHRVRAIKTPGEIEAMTKAAEITTQAYKRVMQFMKAGKWEFELEAEFMHEFLSNRSRGFAYTPIIAGGFNACVLHYIENKDQLQDGDLVLFDVGAEYANYSCDVTRCYPVNGKYTDRQKEIYSAVLRVKKEAEKLLVPGNNLNDYHKQVGEIMTKELVDLKLLTMDEVKNADPSWPAYKKYFMHGTSHYIGLDTHDAGLWTADIEPNMVFTCEPGIYLPDENLGVRLEDDLVVTENGLNNLTEGIPIEIEEIEEFMNS